LKQKKKYFVLNKESDFRKGYGEGIQMSASGIRLAKGMWSGVYFTRVFDSCEKMTVWQRMQLTGEFYGEASVEVTVYASESPELVVDGRLIAVEHLLRDSEILAEQKERYMANCQKAVFSHPRDVLLHQTQGRYLWLKITLTDWAGQVPTVARIQIYFPKDTWLNYLPEVYEQDRESASFLERYLSIFQSVYEDMTKRIEEVPALLNPWRADPEPLLWMAQWLSAENLNLWQEEQIRYLTANAVRLYQGRGTVGGLAEILRLYTGREPYIIERQQLEPFFDGSRTEADLKRLYSSNPYEFSVLLDLEGIETNNRSGILKKLVDMAKPAHMECRIVALKPYIFLGQHSYLGINSVLGQYKAFQLDGLCAVPFSIVAEE